MFVKQYSLNVCLVHNKHCLTNNVWQTMFVKQCLLNVCLIHDKHCLTKNVWQTMFVKQCLSNNICWMFVYIKHYEVVAICQPLVICILNQIYLFLKYAVLWLLRVLNMSACADVTGSLVPMGRHWDCHTGSRTWWSLRSLNRWPRMGSGRSVSPIEISLQVRIMKDVCRKE